MNKLFVSLTLVVASCMSSGATKASAPLPIGYGLPSDNPAICMANNLYHEAKGQPTAGQIAVGLVVMNRVKDSRFPNSVCKVVYQAELKESWKTKQNPDLPDNERKYFPRKHRCQFSWYCDGKADTIYNMKAYATLYALSQRILTGRYDGMIEGATHYHADYVNPDWNTTKTRVAVIGDHIFYRWD